MINNINYVKSNPNRVVKYSHHAFADTGKTGNDLTSRSPCFNKHVVSTPLPIKMPNREIINSTNTGYLRINNLPEEAQRAHIFPYLNRALLSIGTVCEHGFITVFDDR